MRKEIGDELRIETLDRFAVFSAKPGRRAIAGRRQAGLGRQRLAHRQRQRDRQAPPALSLYQVRERIKEYLNDATKSGREQVFENFRSEEGSAPANVIEILSHSKPFYDLPEPVAADKPGYFKLEVPGMTKEAKTAYWVQLPPEYDPYRRYPTILA